MVSREGIEAVLERIRPFMRADGGDIELVDIRGNDAFVRLTGMCARCPMASMTLHLGIEVALREHLQGFGHLQLA